MAVTFGAFLTASNAEQSGVGQASIATSAPIAVVAGDLVVVWVKHEGLVLASTPTVSDGLNAATPGTPYVSNANGDVHGRAFYYEASRGGSLTFTATFPGGTATYCRIYVVKCTPSVPVRFIDSSGGSGSSTAVSSGPMDSVAATGIGFGTFGEYSAAVLTAFQIGGVAADGNLYDTPAGSYNAIWWKAFTAAQVAASATCTQGIVAAWISTGLLFEEAPSATYDRYLTEDGTGYYLVEDASGYYITETSGPAPSGNVGTAASTAKGGAEAATATESQVAATASTAPGGAEAATATESQVASVATTAKGGAEAATATESQTGTAASTEAGGAEAATGTESQTGTAASTEAGGAEAVTATESQTGTAADAAAGGAEAATGTESQTATGASTTGGAAEAATGVESQLGTVASAAPGGQEAATGTESQTGTMESTEGGAAEAASGEPATPNIGTAESTAAPPREVASGSMIEVGTLDTSLMAGYAAALAEEQQRAAAAAQAAGASEAASGVEAQAGAAQSVAGAPSEAGTSGMAQVGTVEETAAGAQEAVAGIESQTGTMESTEGGGQEFAGTPPPNIGTMESTITAEQWAAALEAQYGTAESTAGAGQEAAGPAPAPADNVPSGGAGSFAVTDYWVGPRHNGLPIMWGKMQSGMGGASIRILVTMTGEPTPPPEVDEPDSLYTIDDVLDLLIASGYLP